jgi:hypothetical protein
MDHPALLPLITGIIVAIVALV